MLMFGWDFEVNAKSRFKFDQGCVRTCDMNSLAMFLNAPLNQAIHKDTSNQSLVASRADFLSCKLKYIFISNGKLIT